MEKEIRDLERDVLQRDRIITELRVRLPATADRDQLVAKATSAAASRMTEDDDYEGKQAVRVAQSTITSLQVKLLVSAP